jgi:hypothetical protein
MLGRSHRKTPSARAATLRHQLRWSSTARLGAANHHGWDRAGNARDLLPRQVFPGRIPHDARDQPLVVGCRVEDLELWSAAHKEAL